MALAASDLHAGNLPLLHVPTHLQADLLQVEVVRPNFQETTALGAALAAGCAVGLWSHTFATAHPPNDSTRFKPSISAAEAEKRYGHWSKAVGRALDLADLAEK